jgi:3-isopropylmalate/(R)-2-methylmalate dehydratase large subunit
VGQTVVLRTLFDKIWDSHRIRALDDGRDLIFVDRHLLQETTSAAAFDGLTNDGRKVAAPTMTFATQDHIVSTELVRSTDSNPGGRELIGLMRSNARTHHIPMFGLDDPRQGIVHVIGPELGLVTPGTMIACGDSHTATAEALLRGDDDIAAFRAHDALERPWLHGRGGQS